MLEIKNIFCDLDINLEAYKPINAGFIILIDIEIGTKNQLGCDNFSFTLCDNKGLFNLVEQDILENNGNPISLNGYKFLIVEKFDYLDLMNTLNRILSECYSKYDTWLQTAKKLNEYFHWEYQREKL